jgi:hypothetical protein
VDDPVLAALGDLRSRNRAFARVLLVWIALGAKLAWSKASLGPSVCWTGATYKIVPFGVVASISKQRLEKLLASARALRNSSSNLVKGLRSFAGEINWVAGIVPRLRPIVSMVYAAMTAHDDAQKLHDARKRPKGMYFLKQVQRPLEWIEKFLDAKKAGLHRSYWLSDRHRQCELLVRTDASTTGVGAILLTPAGYPVAWMADIIRSDDKKIIGFPNEGDPAWMCEAELLALLLALHAWKTRLSGKRMSFIVQMDSSSALNVALKLGSSVPTVNYLAAELSLLMEELDIELLEGAHYRGILNVEADALSRLTEGKKVPRSLAQLKMTAPPSRDKVYQLHHFFD